MSHSFTKLDLLLQTNGFIPLSIFTIDNYCVYIEILCTTTSDIFLLYISSQFNIRPDKYKSYKINYIEIEDLNNVIDKYAEEPDKSDVKNDYFEIDIEDEEKHENLETSLSENYNKEIILKNIANDKIFLKDIHRQLERFRFCVQNINYKIAILYKNYLCTIKRDDSLESYHISNFPLKNKKKMYITIDLKSFYKKLDTVKDDFQSVKKSIFKILNNNQEKHTKILSEMLQNKDTLNSYTQLLESKKQYYNKYLSDLEIMLKKLNENEKTLLDQKNSINKKGIDSGIKGLHSDIQDSHSLYNINSKISKVYELKKELSDDILKSRIDQENITLEIDKILFDNSVMLNQIIKNFNSLMKIIE